MIGSADNLLGILSRWRRHKIVVVGDFMLDHHVYGNAQRLSPDAPVPVLTTERDQHMPGGAANVCLDLRALQCRVAAIGIVGRDDHGSILRHALKLAGCQVAGIIPVNGRPTTVKHNFVGLAQHRHPQKMFRVDLESNAPIESADATRLLDQARRALRGASALCIEDYNKGVLTPDVCKALIAMAKKMGVPVLIDPAAITDYQKYRGCTCITPNRTEASLATGLGETQVEAMAKALMRQLKCNSVVLTLDKQGALLLEKGKRPLVLPTVARLVYDVTGAGDMVLAMLSAAVANNADWPSATQLANVAAGLEVERFGVVPITLDEVLLSVLQLRHAGEGKVRELDMLLPELFAQSRQGKRIVFTNGCFDILHAGHVSYLRQARACGDLLVVALNSDRSIRRIKGKGRPVNHQDDRVLVISELQSVDYVIVFDQDTPIKLIQAIRPDVLVKGADYRKDQVVGGKEVESWGGRVELVKLVAGRSTTNIIGRIIKEG